MTVWFTSDLHLGHDRIRLYEPEVRDRFATIGAMNDAIVDAHNSLVEPDDLVYVLGDLALGDFFASMDRAAELHGNKLLIAGNHDRHSPAMRARGVRLEQWRTVYRNRGFELLPDEVEIEVAEHTVLLSHYPYRGLEGADTTRRERYADLRPIDRGLPLIHGHVHSLWRTRDRLFNVGIDANRLRPTHESEIAGWLDTLGPDDHPPSSVAPR